MPSSIKPVVVLGGGGHGRVLIDALAQAGRRILGVLDPALPAGSRVLDAEVLGDERWLHDRSPDQFELVNGLGSLPGADRARCALFARWRQRGYRFAAVVHPSALLGAAVQLGEGVQIMAGAVLQTGASVGANSIVNTGALVDHDCRIGADCHLAPGVVLSGGVVVGDGSHLGTGASVIQGIVIGRRVVVAAGAMVYRDLADELRYIPGKPDQRGGP